MPVVVHGIKDGIDETLEMTGAVIRNLETLPEPSLEHEETLVELREARSALTRARDRAAAAQRRTRSRTTRGG